MLPSLSMSHFIFIVFFTVWIAFALGNVVNPKFIWRIMQSWKSNQEPSRTYFISQRIIGAIMVGIGIWFMYTSHIFRA